MCGKKISISTAQLEWLSTRVFFMEISKKNIRWNVHRHSIRYFISKQYAFTYSLHKFNLTFNNIFSFIIIIRKNTGEKLVLKKLSKCVIILDSSQLIIK